ncbi:MAG: ATP-binding protein [Myxococcota bacterium]
MEDFARAHLRAELDWLWTYLEGHLRRLQAAGVLPSDAEPYPGTSIAPTEIEARLAARRLAAVPTPLPGSAALDALAARSRELVERAPERAWLPLLRLRQAFGLDDLDGLLLLMALAHELEPGFARLFAFIQNHFARQYPTAALVMELVPAEARLDVRARLAPDAPLVRHGLVLVDGRDPALPLAFRAFRAHPRIVRLAEGWRGLDPALAEVARWDPLDLRAEQPTIDWPELALATERCHRFAATTKDGGSALLVLRGEAGAGKSRLAGEVAAVLGGGLLTVSLPALANSAGGLQEGLGAAFREARLLRATLLLDGLDDLAGLGGHGAQPGGAEREAERPSDLAERVARLLGPCVGGHVGLVVLAVRELGTALPPLRPAPPVIDLPRPDARAAEAFWRRFLPADQRGPGAEPERLARAHPIAPGLVRGAVEHARRLASVASDVVKPLSARELAVAVKRQLQHRLGDAALLVEPRHRMDDLVVSPEVKLQLEEIIERHRQRVRVLEDWGLGGKVGRDVGMPVLFDGPPGTGKSMSASIIAGVLELDLYQVDLSRMVSKWIGETEKNLARLFDEAERSGAILLFDEADSLFAKRTGVESSNDRYANLEVNFLLQRVERFSGIAILTTNFPESIDEAFKRRITLRVTFERPGPREREALWKSLLGGPRVPLGADVDFAELAKAFELTGGLIRNAVLRAAFIAASRTGVIDMDALESSARVELRKHGAVVRGRTA